MSYAESFNFTAEEIEAMSKRILSVAPEDGSKIGNKTARSKLGIDESNSEEMELYKKARDMLIDSQKLIRGSGQTGSFGLYEVNVPQEQELLDEVAEDALLDVVAKEAGDKARDETRKETQLYPDIEEGLRKHWLLNTGLFPEKYSHFIVANTSKSGPLKVGKWRQPDFVAVAVSQYKYLPGKYLDVVTFEVKIQSAFDITAVYETVSHKRRATQSYLIVQYDGDYNDDPAFNEALKEADNHGIGLIVVHDIKDYDNGWVTVRYADRVEPEPKELDDFIDQISKKNDIAENLAMWLK